MKTETAPLFDVVIFEIATGKIDSIAGTNLRSEEHGRTGFHSVEKRVDTVSPRLNDSYSVKAVPAGKYAKGDKLKGEDRG